MTPAPETQPVYQRRLQEAGAPLAENSSLRDALDDEQARQLLAWGLAQIEREVQNTLALSDEEALPRLRERADLVRGIMRRLNDLVDSAPGSGEAEIWRELLQLTRRLRALQPTPEEQQEALQDAHALAEARLGLDRNTAFGYLMNILHHEGPA